MWHIVQPGTNFDIIGKQKTLMVVSALLVLASILIVIFVGPNYGIDFKGGSDIILGFKGDVQEDEVRAAAQKAGFTDASVQRFGTADKNQFLIQTASVSVVDKATIEKIRQSVSKQAKVVKSTWTVEQPDRYDITLEKNVELSVLVKAAESVGLENVKAERVGTEKDRKYVIRFQDLQSRISVAFFKAFPKRFPDPSIADNKKSAEDQAAGVIRLETVGARVGNQLREDGLTAFMLSLLAILIYIAVRFDIRYAPGAVVAIFHDVLIAFGVLTIAQIEINLPILAAALTIVGYSLNDTIVVFDRIRENYTAGHGGNTLSQITNTSINETLSRTLITSLTTFIAVAVIAILGSGLIVNFAITLIIGVVVGTYSSIFVASPILLIMDNWLRNRQEAKALRTPTNTDDAEPAV